LQEGLHGPSDLASKSTSETQKRGEGTKLLTATFAGGCFWCTEADFEKANGMVKVISGYAGGEGANPMYQDFASKVMSRQSRFFTIPTGPLIRICWIIFGAILTPPTLAGNLSTEE
jgi:hypothetical protein